MRDRLLSSSTLLALLAAGCTMVGRATPVIDLAGEWNGALVLDGQTIPATLRLAQDGEDLDAALTAADIGTLARGAGSLSERRVSLTVEYEVECPGTAVMVGTVVENGTLEGTPEATDCTGTVDGGFTFRRGEG